MTESANHGILLKSNGAREPRQGSSAAKKSEINSIIYLLLSLTESFELRVKSHVGTTGTGELIAEWNNDRPNGRTGGRIIVG